jgi:hypothetical protein
MSDIISDHQLSKECESVAVEIFQDMLDGMAPDETPEDHRDTMSDRAHEYADGHQWVIYTHYALSICAHCNTDQGEELVDDIGPPKPFSLGAAAAMIAYGEMRARIESAISDLVDAWEDKRDNE